MLGWFIDASTLASRWEPRESIRISRKRLGQNLQRYLSPELGISGLIHLSHAPLADEGGHVVMGEAGADG